MRAEPTREVVLMGDSHIEALRRAAAKQDRRLVVGATSYPLSAGMVLAFSDAVEPFFEVAHDGVRLATAEGAQRLQALLGEPLIRASGARIIGISMPYTTSLILWSGAWKASRPWRHCPEKQCDAVSDGVVRAIARHHFRHIFEFLQAIRDRGSDCFVVESPPPRSDDRGVERLTAAGVLELDTIVRRAVREKLEELGIDTVPVPASAYSAGPGTFLNDSYRRLVGEDLHHASDEFGALQLDAIASFLATRHPASFP